MKTLLILIIILSACSQKISTSPSKKDYALKESKRNHYYQSTIKHFLKANK